MSQLQINHNEHLKKMRNEGFDVSIIDGHIVVRHIPYMNKNKETLYGTLLSDFNLSGNQILKPINHVMKFSGEFPCNIDGTEISGISHGNTNNTLSSGIKVNYSFSNKPSGGFVNFYDKFISYIRIISAPAVSSNPSVTITPYNPIEVDNNETVFKYLDSNSSRAGIDSLNRKLENQRIAIIGLGGTGSYILDLVSKSSVKEIHLFDGDMLLNHNAFRCPGAISLDTLKSKPFKVDYYSSLYSNMRNGIYSNPIFISEDNLSLLDGYDYIFLCIDNNEIRYLCSTYLSSKDIPFSDVGLGVYIHKEQLLGTIRVTSSSSLKKDHLEGQIPKVDEDDANEYSTNIQIAELNCLNATLAVMQWKKHSEFYQDLNRGHSVTYSINDSNLINSDYET